MQKIYFRADASAAIGYGHFIRTLALADMLKDNFDCTFFTCHPTPYQVSEMEKVCPFVTLQEETHYDEFLSQLQGDEIVVLDNYYFTSEYQSKIKQKGCKLVCIDDVHDKHFYADIVINHTPGMMAEYYSCEPYTRLLLGPSYLLLRKPFFDAINQKSDSPSEQTFICFGGSDEYNLTKCACKIIRNIDNRPIIAVVGGGYLYRDDLENFSIDNNINIYSNVDAETMANLMKLSSLAIVPASCTFLEACCSRIPIITGFDADNQLFIAESCERLGLGYNCGDLRENFDQKLTSALKAMSSDKEATYKCNQQKYISDSSNVLIQKFMEL